MLEQSIAEVKSDKVWSESCECDHCSGIIDKSRVISVLKSFTATFDEYDEELLYIDFNHEKLLDKIGELVAEMADCADNFDTDGWLDIHKEDE